MLLLRTDWPKGHDTTDPKWWNDSPYLTKEAAQWVVNKKPSVVGYDFAQEEKGADYQQADQILESAMRVHRTILPKVIFQIENLINLDQIGSRQSGRPTGQMENRMAPARVIAILDN
jgi:kynurenine formamidase